MNPADVLLSGEYPSLSPLPLSEDELPVQQPAPLQGMITNVGGADLSPEGIAHILVAVNQSLGIDLGELDYAQFIVPEGQEEEDTRRSRDGKREYTHIQLVCEACGHIIIAVAKAVNMAIQEAGDDPEAKSTLPKRKRGGILGFKELAAKAKLSPWHFHRVFRSITDVTPKAYGEACWDYLLRTNGFSVEPRSPQLPDKSMPSVVAAHPGRGPGRIGKSTSRSRSRSRPRHPSQTQAQVLTALTGADEVRRRSRSAARSSSFSNNRFLPDFTPTDFSPEMAIASTPTSIPPMTSARTRRNSTPQQSIQQPTPLQQPVQFMPPGTVAGSVGEYMYPAEPPNMYDSLAYPETFLPEPVLDPIIPTPALDSTIESTPSTGYEILEDARLVEEPRAYDAMPDLNTLSLTREFDWKREDPSLAPYVGDPDVASQFFIDKEYETYRDPTPDFSNLKLLDPIEEPSLFKTEY